MISITLSELPNQHQSSVGRLSEEELPCEDFGLFSVRRKNSDQNQAASFRKKPGKFHLTNTKSIESIILKDPQAYSSLLTFVNITEFESIESYSDSYTCLEFRKASMRIKAFFSKLSEKIAYSNIFEFFIIIVILINTAFLAIEDPNKNYTSGFYYDFELFFLYTYTVECLLKISARGVVLKEKSYFRDYWNILDFTIVLTSWIGMYSNGVKLNALRSLRILRPLRGISSVKGIRVIFQSLVRSIKPLLHSLIIMLAFLLLFSIAALQLWMGLFRNQCLELNTGVFQDLCGSATCETGYECASTIRNPVYNTISFDNIFYSLIYIFQIITLEGWTDIMKYTQKTFSYFSFLFFLPLVFIGSYLIINLSIAIITSNFSEELEKNMKKNEETPVKAINFVEYLTKRQTLMQIELQKRNSMRENMEKEFVERETITNIASNVPDRLILLTNHVYSNKILFPTQESVKNENLSSRENKYIVENPGVIVEPTMKSFAADLQWKYSSCYVDYILSEIKIAENNEITQDLDEVASKQKIYLTSEKKVESTSMSDFSKEPFEDPLTEGSLQNKIIVKYPDFSDPYKLFLFLTLKDSKKIAFFKLKLNVNLHISAQIDNADMSSPQFNDVSMDNNKFEYFQGHSNYRIWHRSPYRYFQMLQKVLHKLLESPQFGTFIIILVISNVICLSLDYYGTSTTTENNLLQANLFFTFVFFSEMILKIIGYNLINYCRNSMNLLDAIVVILSLIEFFVISGKSGTFNAFRVIRIFRIFRILRVLKIFRYLKSMVELLKIISESLSEFFYLFCLLLLFCVIFSLLGMQIFGGNFNFTEGTPNGNFDDFNWAFITIFQLLTEENWNNTLVSAMRYQPFSVIFLVIWLIIGNFVLLNIFLAILLKGFETEGLEIEEDIEKCNAKGHLFKSRSNKFREKNIKELEMLEVEEEEIDSNMDISELENILKKKSKKFENKLYEGVACEKSLFLFKKSNPLRIFLYRFCTSSLLEFAILSIIIASTIKLVFDTYILTYPADSKEVYISNIFDILFTILFAFEFLVKVISYGFIKEKGSYLSDSWNFADFVILVLSVLDLSLTSINIPVIKVLRLLRTLRPLRLISHNISMKIIVSALISSLIAILNILGIIFLIWLVFAILGVSLFGGKYYSCTNSFYFSQSDCVFAGFSWENNFYNFDNVLEAMSTLFSISSQESWPNRMFDGINATGVGTGPIDMYNPLAAYYFILYVIVGQFFLVNLFTAVVYNKFNQAKKKENSMASYLLTKDQLNWIDLQGLIVKSQPRFFFTKRNSGCLPKKLTKIIASNYFDIFMIVIILLNTVSMAIVYQDAPATYLANLNTINDICTYFFIAEAVVKILGFGRIYFLSSWNKFDFFVVLSSVANIFLDNITSSSVPLLRTGPQIIRVIRVLRISRMFRVFKSLKAIQTMIDVIVFSLPAMLNVLSLMILLFFIYAVLGSYLFYQVDSGTIIDPYFNFSNFHSSMIILWRISTGEDYPYIITDCTTALNSKVYILYFFSFVTLSTFIFLDLFVSVIIQNYQEYEDNHESTVYIFNNRISHFKKIWNKYTYNWKGLRISYKDLPDLMKALGPDLGVPEDLPHVKVLKILAAMDLEIDQHGYIYYNDMLFAVMKKNYGKKILISKDTLIKKFLRQEEHKIYKELAKIRVKQMRRMKSQASLGDHKIDKFFIFLSSANVKPFFNAWKRFKEEKMGNDEEDSIYLE